MFLAVPITLMVWFYIVWFYTAKVAYLHFIRHKIRYSLFGENNRHDRLNVSSFRSVFVSFIWLWKISKYCQLMVEYTVWNTGSDDSKTGFKTV